MGDPFIFFPIFMQSIRLPPAIKRLTPPLYFTPCTTRSALRFHSGGASNFVMLLNQRMYFKSLKFLFINRPVSVMCPVLSYPTISVKPFSTSTKSPAILNVPPDRGQQKFLQWNPLAADEQLAPGFERPGERLHSGKALPAPTAFHLDGGDGFPGAEDVIDLQVSFPPVVDLNVRSGCAVHRF